MISLVLYSLTSCLSFNLVYGVVEDIVPVVKSQINMTVVLTCPIKVLNGKVQWYRLNPEGTYSQGQTVNQDLLQHNRLKVVGNFSEGEFNLQISKVTIQDRGKYLCSAYINKSLITKSVYLQITAIISRVTTQDISFLQIEILPVTIPSTYSSALLPKFTTHELEKKTTESGKEKNNNTNIYYGLLGVGILAFLSFVVILGDLIYRHCQGRNKQQFQSNTQQITGTNNVDSPYDYVIEDEMIDLQNTDNSTTTTYLDVVMSESPVASSYQQSFIDKKGEEICIRRPYSSLLPYNLDMA